MTTRPLRFAHGRGRLVTPAELWAMHGWPTLSVPGSRCDLQMPFAIADLSVPAALRLVGNGLHLP
eukprot:8401028-Alexandrium_andersonii.AAC.1